MFIVQDVMDEGKDKDIADHVRTARVLVACSCHVVELRLSLTPTVALVWMGRSLTRLCLCALICFAVLAV